MGACLFPTEERYMTKLEDVLERMRDEPAFAEAVLHDATHALAEYHLPAEHIARLKAMSRAEFEALATERQKILQMPVQIPQENQ
jgi:hypothetical protein